MPLLTHDVPDNLRVFVYRNLSRKCWSVKALEGPQRGRVIAHVDPLKGQELSLRCVEFRVQEGGRQRVLRTRRKHVHAGVVGRVASCAAPFWDSERVTYDPYQGPTFCHFATGDAVRSAAGVELTLSGVRAWNLKP